MKREISLEEISDGRLYGGNDMVKADCGDCKGCSACCRGMGRSIVLDPLDVFWLCRGLNQTFGQLLERAVELSVVDGIVLPNLKMTGKEEACFFLDEQGRCSIHAFRPGICRLFPLGRYYENRSFQYFLQVKECRNQNRTKVKVRKWVDVPEFKAYEAFINRWHYYLRQLQDFLEQEKDEAQAREVSMKLLKTFYFLPYKTDENFYSQFYERLEQEL